MEEEELQEMIVYLVTDGAYSDYHVEGAFSSEKEAQRYIKACCTSGCIEEYELDCHDREVLLYKQGFSGWEVELGRYDTDVSKDKGRVSVRKIEIPSSTDEWKRKILFYPSKPSYMRLTVVAKTREGALKIAREKERQAIAEGWWGISDYDKTWEPLGELGD